MTIRFVILALIIALVPGSARADYIFEFAENGTISQSFNVNAGSTVTIQVYLAQTGTTTGLSSPGLSAGGVALTGYNQSTAGVTAISGNVGPGAFDTATTSGTGMGQANLNVGVVTSAPVTATNGAILLGSFTFTGVSAGTTFFQTTLPNPDPPFASNVLASNPPTDIDSLITGASGTITVTAVPEPSTFVLGGLLFVGIACTCYLRRRLPRVAA